MVWRTIGTTDVVELAGRQRPWPNGNTATEARSPRTSVRPPLPLPRPHRNRTSVQLYAGGTAFFDTGKDERECPASASGSLVHAAPVSEIGFADQRQVITDGFAF